ncbi:hypothetical protein G7066_14415 [Leucobacter coleopterorum]|uniref:Uncharacterized protein n=1 Tax=Leucobacter coleopterorum TaxID=2714933 RepID=A0ABX6JYU0_9MICO|nr:hypothetical protein [Leucobacter coleopterorum]QIM19466.1 hypothetical protein G7066_14415 [Leucobacter coleopterorum]
MREAPPGNIGMSDLWKQGQNTQERLAKLEVIVERLAKVDERLDSHSDRLRHLEGPQLGRRVMRMTSARSTHV